MEDGCGHLRADVPAKSPAESDHASLQRGCNNPLNLGSPYFLPAVDPCSIVRGDVPNAGRDRGLVCYPGLLRALENGGRWQSALDLLSSMTAQRISDKLSPQLSSYLRVADSTSNSLLPWLGFSRSAARCSCLCKVRSTWKRVAADMRH